MNSCVGSVGIDQERQRTGRVLFVYVPQMFWNACFERIAMCGFIHFENDKVGGGIGRGMVAESARATGMCGRMCSSEGLGKAAGLSVAVRFWGWMGSFGELEDEE